MEHELTKIIQELSSHESQLAGELEELSDRMKKVSELLNQIVSAMNALQGSTQTKLGKKSESPSRVAPSQIDIEEIISKILREKKSVPSADLIQQVKSQLLANGQSRLGLKSLFAKAVSSKKFKIDSSQNVSNA